MIKFNESYHEYSSQNKLKGIINEMINNLDSYQKNSIHGGLSPSHIQDIIAYLMYTEKLSSLEIKITPSTDEYHLNLEILNKES
jgi:hypothetical protein